MGKATEIAVHEQSDEAALLNIWQMFGSRLTWATESKMGVDRAVAAEQTLADLPHVTALEALRANAHLVGLLTGRRWYVMQAAREAGATWDEIGEALGMSRQGAYDWYRRKISHREECIPEIHDAARARSALGVRTLQ